MVNVKAAGGGDAAEDMAGGFEKVLEQNWHKGSTKVGVLICDSPCHGSKFQQNLNSSDDYPNGDPKGRDIEEQIRKIAALGVDLYGIKCNETTNNMFNVFNMSYKRITHRDIIVSKLGQNTSLIGKDEKGLLSNNGRTANSAFSTFICNSATQSLSQRYSQTGDSSGSAGLGKQADKLMKDFVVLLANRESLENPQRLDSVIDQISKLQGLSKETAIQLSQAHTYLKDEISGLKNQQRILHLKNKVETSNIYKMKTEVTEEAKKDMKSKDSSKMTESFEVNAHNFYIV